jgi:hypothetical protein
MNDPSAGKASKDALGQYLSKSTQRRCIDPDGPLELADVVSAGVGKVIHARIQDSGHAGMQAGQKECGWTVLQGLGPRRSDQEFEVLSTVASALHKLQRPQK